MNVLQVEVISCLINLLIERKNNNLLVQTLETWGLLHIIRN